MNSARVANILGHEVVRLHTTWVLAYRAAVAIRLLQAQFQGNIDAIFEFKASFHDIGGAKDQQRVTQFTKYQSCTIVFLDFQTYHDCVLFAFSAVKVLYDFTNFKQYSEGGKILPAGHYAYEVDYNSNSGRVIG
jgi:hypothetical protein